MAKGVAKVVKDTSFDYNLFIKKKHTHFYRCFHPATQVVVQLWPQNELNQV